MTADGDTCMVLKIEQNSCTGVVLLNSGRVRFKKLVFRRFMKADYPDMFTALTDDLATRAGIAKAGTMAFLTQAGALSKKVMQKEAGGLLKVRVE